MQCSELHPAVCEVCLFFGITTSQIWLCSPPLRGILLSALLMDGPLSPPAGSRETWVDNSGSCPFHLRSAGGFQGSSSQELPELWIGGSSCRNCCVTLYRPHPSLGLCLLLSSRWNSQGSIRAGGLLQRPSPPPRQKGPSNTASRPEARTVGKLDWPSKVPRPPAGPGQASATHRTGGVRESLSPTSFPGR